MQVDTVAAIRRQLERRGARRALAARAQSSEPGVSSDCFFCTDNSDRDGGPCQGDVHANIIARYCACLQFDDNDEGPLQSLESQKGIGNDSMRGILIIGGMESMGSKLV